MQQSSIKSEDAFKTIGEVADYLGVQHHVLRFWETKFHVIKPLKRGGGRRFYRPDDVEIIQAIHKLLHEDGYTIKGVQKLIKDHGKKYLIGQLDSKQNHVHVNDDQDLGDGFNGSYKRSDNHAAVLKEVLNELKALRQLL